MEEFSTDIFWQVKHVLHLGIVNTNLSYYPVSSFPYPAHEKGKKKKQSFKSTTIIGYTVLIR